MNPWRKLFILSAMAWAVGMPLAIAQVPGMFPWWDSPIARDLGLSPAQKTQIRARLDEWRDRIFTLNNHLDDAEKAMRAQFDRELIDERQAADAIDKAVAARGELGRAVSMMSLQLRQALTFEQWRELQKRQQELQRRPPPEFRPGMPLPGQRGRPSRPPMDRPEDFRN